MRQRKECSIDLVLMLRAPAQLTGRDLADGRTQVECSDAARNAIGGYRWQDEAMSDNQSKLREWTVAAAIIRSGPDVLMVRNRRKNGSHDWSTPGGVVEPGEQIVEALTREVIEETGVTVTNWSEPRYSVVTVAIGMGWHLTVEVFEALSWTGNIFIDDPDKIVEEAVFLTTTEAIERLATTARWVSEPIADWLNDPWGGHRQYGYELSGVDRNSMLVHRHQ